MVKSCCVLNCPNKHVLGLNKRFYRFPKRDPERRDLWVRALSQGDWTPQANSRVCSDHFVAGEKSHNRASPNYVPSIFPHTSISERRRLQKLYDEHCKLLAERIDKINATTILISIVESDLAKASWLELEKSDSEHVKHEGTVKLKEGAGMPYPRRGTEMADVGIQTAEENLISCLEAECINLRTELDYYKGSFVFEDMTIEVLQNADEKIKYLTGLETYDMLAVLSDMFCCYVTDVHELSGFQMLFMTLVKMKLNLPNSFVGIMFNVDPHIIGSLFILTVEILFSKIVPLLISWPSRDELRDVLPCDYEECENSLYVVDCCTLHFQVENYEVDSPIKTERFRNASDVLGHIPKRFQGLKKYFLVIAPQGTIIFVSRGRSGDLKNRIVSIESGFLDYVQEGDVIVIERELNIESEVKGLGASLVMSNSVKSRAGIEKENPVGSDLVHIRWTMHILKQKYQMLRGTVPLNWMTDVDDENFTLVDKIVHVTCALFNMTNKVWTFRKYLVPSDKENSTILNVKLEGSAEAS